MRFLTAALLAAAASAVSAVTPSAADATPLSTSGSAPAATVTCEARDLSTPMRRLCEAVQTRDCTLAGWNDYWLCVGLVGGQCGVIRGSLLWWLCEGVQRRACAQIGALDLAVALCRGVTEDRCDRVRDEDRMLCEALVPGVQALLGRGGGSVPGDVRPPPRLAHRQAIRVGQSVRGELTTGDGVLASGRAYYDAYRIQAVRGQRLVIDLVSRDFDTYLHLVRDDGAATTPLAEDDDGLGSGTDSRLRALVPATGAYVIRVTSYSAGETGGYTLSVRDAGPPPRVVTQPLPFGAPVAGALAENDAVLSGSWTHYDQYSFEGRQGQRVDVDLQAAAFAAQVELWRVVEGRWVRVAQGRSGGAGRRAVFTAALPAAGTYYVLVRSEADLQLGDYTLTARTPLAVPPETRRPEPGPNRPEPDTTRREDPERQPRTPPERPRPDAAPPLP
jgi:hypothetical protein